MDERRIADRAVRRKHLAAHILAMLVAVVSATGAILDTLGKMETKIAHYVTAIDRLESQMVRMEQRLEKCEGKT
jgi:hypothetical protein